MSAFNSTISARRPAKRFTASAAPSGRPSTVAMSTADRLTSRLKATMCQSSRSSSSTRRSPSAIALICGRVAPAPVMNKDAPPPIAFRAALAFWLKLGFISFGGPAGQIAIMHRVLVDEKKWIEESRFLHALNFSVLLPGPEATKLATYIGWLMHGTRGGLAAGILFVLPGALVMLGLSLLYALGRGVPVVEGALFGIKAAVLVIVVEALIRIGRRALKTRLLVAVAALAFIAIFFFAMPFPLIVVAAGLAGFYASARTAAPPAVPVPGRWRHAALAVVSGLALWWLPVAAAALVLGGSHVLVDVGLFFSKLAVVSFGGAYALLAYMAQQAVETYHWMSAPEMVDGLGLAETTPGPLILVTQFVGVLAAYRESAPFAPLAAGVPGAEAPPWVTFVPATIPI